MQFFTVKAQFLNSFYRIIKYVLDVYCKNPWALDAMRELLVVPSNRQIKLLPSVKCMKILIQWSVNIVYKREFLVTANAILYMYDDTEYCCPLSASTTKILLVKRRVGLKPEWCQREAKRHNLKQEEYWGGLLMDEMKIQVWYRLCEYMYSEIL